jgi:hypothetical protein
MIHIIKGLLTKNNNSLASLRSDCRTFVRISWIEKGCTNPQVTVCRKADAGDILDRIHTMGFVRWQISTSGGDLYADSDWIK